MMPGNLPEIREYLAHLARRATDPDKREFTSRLEGYLALDAGRPAEADSLLGAGQAADEIRVLAGLFWGGDTTAAARAVGRLRAAPDQIAGRGFLGEAPACLIGLWDLSRGSTTGLEGRSRALRESAAGRDPTWPPNRNQVCALVLEAGLAEAAGSPRAAALVDSLNAVLLRGPGLAVLNWQNLAVSGMLERRGDYARAAAAARRTRQYWVYIPYLSSYYREAGRLAELAGDRDRAIEGYARYLQLRKNPEPSVQPEVDRVREALSRLTSERN